MRPVIGIEVDIEESSSNRRLYTKCYQTYIDAIWRAGGMPRLIAPIEELEYLSVVIAEIDGLVIPGGDDIAARHFGAEPHPCERTTLVREERVSFGRRLVEACLGRRKAILGICYGAQLVNVVLGGSIYQDLADLRPGSDAHKSDGDADLRHRVELAEGSALSKMFGRRHVEVNSVHHQAIERAGSGLVVSARAPDGVIEAVECPERSVYAVQWHPERPSCGPSGPELFRAFVSVSRARSAAQRHY